MVINKVLDSIFSTKSNLSILRILLNINLGLSGREISRLAGLSPKAGIASLGHLENLGIVNRIRGGRDHIFSLNRVSFLVSGVITPLLASESKFKETLFSTISKKLNGKCNSAFIYGSVARKEEDFESDLDICIVYDSKYRLKSIELILEELRTIIFKRYNTSISPFYITRLEFLKRVNRNSPPVSNIKNEGLLIFGQSITELGNGKKI